MKPKVSVCVPVYHVAGYIEACVKSLMEQTLGEVEYIFVDDRSPDDSIKLLEATVARYPERRNSVTIIRNSENMGPGLSRKRAAAMATGEYIYFPDSDDWMEPDMLESMYRKAIEDKADIVRCHILCHYDNKAKRMPGRIDYSLEEWRRHLIICDDVYIGLTTSLFHRPIIDSILTAYPSVRLYSFEDYLLVVEAFFYASKVSFIERDFYHCNTDNPYSVTKHISERTIESILTVAQSLYEFCASRNDSYIYLPLVRNFMAASKLRFLTDTKMWQPERWRSTWPELNSPEYIRVIGIKTKFYRLIAKCALNKQDKIAYLILRLLNLLDSTRRMYHRIAY